MKTCVVCRLGLTPYEVGLSLQRRLFEARLSRGIPDVLLLLEHPPVITIGRNGKDQNILASKDGLLKERIPVYRTERGGDVTYHGPGQLVGYPILNLKEDNLTVIKYVTILEEIAIKTLGDFGIEAGRSRWGRGIFVNGRKIYALGLKITGGVSTHGFALNVNTDLRYFSYIVPCGLSDIKVTSMSECLGRKLEMGEVQDRLLDHFSRGFNFEMETGEGSAWLVPSLSG